MKDVVSGVEWWGVKISHNLDHTTFSFFEKWFLPPISAHNYVNFKLNLYLCWSVPLKRWFTHIWNISYQQFKKGVISNLHVVIYHTTGCLKKRLHMILLSFENWGTKLWTPRPTVSSDVTLRQNWIILGPFGSEMPYLGRSVTMFQSPPSRKCQNVSYMNGNSQNLSIC